MHGSLPCICLQSHRLRSPRPCPVQKAPKMAVISLHMQNQHSIRPILIIPCCAACNIVNCSLPNIYHVMYNSLVCVCMCIRTSASTGSVWRNLQGQKQVQQELDPKRRIRKAMISLLLTSFGRSTKEGGISS